MKRFFRDLTSGENTEDGMEYHAAGIVLEIHNENSPSGKDMMVGYIHPFTGEACWEWRAAKDVQVYEVAEDSVQWLQWDDVRALLEEQK